MRNMESLAPFEPPHFDAVTSLSIVKDYLVSGYAIFFIELISRSRDKNLRLWSLDHPMNNLKSTSYGHQDWITVTESTLIDFLKFKQMPPKLCYTVAQEMVLLKCGEFLQRNFAA